MKQRGEEEVRGVEREREVEERSREEEERYKERGGWRDGSVVTGSKPPGSEPDWDSCSSQHTPTSMVLCCRLLTHTHTHTTNTHTHL